jgi:spermidine synthase
MTKTTVARRLFLALVLCVFLTPLARPQDYQVVYEIRSQYQLITVLDTESGYRQLIFDGKFDGNDSIQSEMKLSDHYALTLSYARHMMAALPLAGNPKRILIVGLGGASMQRYLYRLLPEAKIETAELDPAICKIAGSHFFLNEDARQIVHLGDGRKFIENSKNKYDIIFLDAFSATSIPYLLSTQEFLKAVKDHLAPGGIACSNLWDMAPEYRDMLKTYMSVFPEQNLLKCADSGNAILVANPNKAGLTAQSWADKARAFEKSHPTGLNLPQLIERGVAAMPDLSGAKVLLDKKASI